MLHKRRSFWKHNISRQILTRSEDYIGVHDLCVLTDNKVLLACGAKGLHALSLRMGQLSAHEPTDVRDVYIVAFDANTDTLLLLVANRDTH